MMKAILLCTGIVVFIIRVETVNVTDLSIPIGPLSQLSKSTGGKENITCQWTDLDDLEAVNNQQAVAIICNLTINRSSCYLCGKDKMEYTIVFTAIKKIANFINELEVISVYSDVSYGRNIAFGNSQHTISCEMRIDAQKSNDDDDDDDETYMHEVHGNVTCKKDSKFSLAVSPCGKMKSRKKRKKKKKNRINTCSINCSEYLHIRVPCSDQMEATSRNTVAIAGGVTGGLFAGVAITVLVVVICWTCRKRRSKDKQAEHGERDSHINLQLNPRGCSSASNISAGISDIKSSELAKTEDVNIYQELPDYRLSKGTPDHAISDGSVMQGDYVELKDEQLDDTDAYCRRKACSRPLPDPFQNSRENTKDFKDSLDGIDDNRHDTCNTTNNKSGALPSAETQPSNVYFVLEDDQGARETYNRLGDQPQTSDRQYDSYNRIGDASDLQDSKPPPEYFILENVKTPNNHDI